MTTIIQSEQQSIIYFLSVDVVSHEALYNFGYPMDCRSFVRSFKQRVEACSKFRSGEVGSTVYFTVLARVLYLSVEAGFAEIQEKNTAV